MLDINSDEHLLAPVRQKMDTEVDWKDDPIYVETKKILRDYDEWSVGFQAAAAVGACPVGAQKIIADLTKVIMKSMSPEAENRKENRLMMELVKAAEERDLATLKVKEIEEQMDHLMIRIKEGSDITQMIKEVEEGELKTKIDKLKDENELLRNREIMMRQEMAEMKGRLEERREILDMFTKMVEKEKEELSICPEKVIENKLGYHFKRGRGTISMIVKPAENVENEITNLADIITKDICLADIGVGIEDLRILKDGGVKITCASSKEFEIVAHEIIETYSDKINIRKETRLNPKIIIYNVPEFMGKDDLVKCLVSQNSLDYEDFNIRFRMQNKIMYCSWVVELKPLAFRCVMGNRRFSKVKLNWSSCLVSEFIRTIRCVNCCKFGHTKNSCRSEGICSRCGEADHKKDDCENEYECVHCKLANEKYQKKYDVNHSSLEKNCPSDRRQLKILKSKINYF